MTPLVSFCDEYFWEIKEHVTTGKTDMQFHILNATSHSFLSYTLIWCVTCLHYIDNFLIIMNKTITSVQSSSLTTQLLTPLVSFCDEYFWEIKENVTTEKTNMQFHILNTPSNSSLSCTLILCVTCLHYIDNFLIIMHKTITVAQSAVFKTQLLTPLVSFCDEYFWEIKENVTTEKIDMQFHILNTPSYSSLSDTLIWCVTCLHYIDSFLMKNAQNYDLVRFFS